MAVAIGFLGFGEVAAIFSAAMRQGGADVSAYDLVQARVLAGGVRYRPLEELVERSDYLLSTVTTQAAFSVAENVRPHLRPGKVYVDLNSTSPSVKVQLEQMVRPTGADFVEGAILGAVGVTGAGTPILTGGPNGATTAQALTSLGLRVSFYSSEVGKASTFKMLRSIFSKGLEALVLELLIAGKRANIDKDLWADVTQFMTENSFDRVAENWIRSHAGACDRRYHEMVQVAETMREIGLDPVMTAATERFFERSRTLGLDAAFPVKPSSADAVATYMEKKLADSESGPKREK